MRYVVALLLVTWLGAAMAAAQGDLVQVEQDFAQGTGWEGVNNRVEAIDPPTVQQDFGWSPGRIGGAVWQSTTPAWYGMKLDRPLSFKDAFSASGKIAVLPDSDPGFAAYLGFFNRQRQGWRPWSSMAMRVVKGSGKTARIYLDYMTGRWSAGAAELEHDFPADGSEHTWRFTYDPDATRPPWTDTRLRGYLTTERQTPDQILAKARESGEPDLTREALQQRLRAALGQGLVTYLPRHGKENWLLKQVKDDLKGAIIVQVDDGMEYRTYLTAEQRDQPVELDRFGIFNMQLYHGVVKFYASDLMVNGKRIDLSKDPGWEGKGNRTTFVERDFQRQNFGYSPDSNYAGGQKGEIGGQFYNVEPIDPHHGYYADDVGRLTLDDPIRFSGKMSFLEGSTDAGMFFGFFNSADEKVELPPNPPGGQATGWPQPNVLGIVIDGPARIGWFVIPFCTPADKKLAKDVEGPVILPTRDHRTIDFVYDPGANGGVGQITVTLDGHKPVTLDLTPQQRQAGGKFDRFGLMSFRRGGKYSTLYFDDLTYTARHPPGYQPVRHEQKITRVPYPPRGRKY
jgi:hypothetical protein